MAKISNNIKWFFQRVFRGYSDYDMMDYDRFACRKILPSLKYWALEKKHIGFPESAGSHEGWQKILEEIVWAVEECAYSKEENKAMDENAGYEKLREIWARQEKGLRLFGEYLPAMWD